MPIEDEERESALKSLYEKGRQDMLREVFNLLIGEKDPKEFEHPSVFYGDCRPAEEYAKWLIRKLKKGEK